MAYIYMELLVKPEMLTSYIYGPIYTTLAFLALLGAPYIYEISNLRVNIIKWQVKFTPVA